MIALDQATVFSGNNGGVGNNPTNFTTSGAVAAGATVLLAIHSNLTPTGVSVGGVAATQDRAQTNTDTTSWWRVRLPSGLSAGGTIAITFASAPNAVECDAFSFSGVATTSPLDQSASKSAFNATAWTSSSITPIVADTLVFGYYRSGGGANSRSTPDAGWTELRDLAQFGNVVIVYQIVGDMAARNPSGTFAVSQVGADQIGITVNYKQEAGGGGPVPSLTLLGVG